MIEIEKISFQFASQDEGFVHSLYRDWDEFCSKCFEKVIDEYLSVYDKKGVVTEIDLIELNLGDIPQEKFYQLFPVRLREELERCVPLMYIENEKSTFSAEHKLDNLWHYLKYGFCRIAVYNSEFCLEDELNLMIQKDKDSVASLLQKLLLEQAALERLLQQTDKSIFAEALAAWLDSSSIGVEDKRHQLFLLAIRNPISLWQIIEKIEKKEQLASRFISFVRIDLLLHVKTIQDLQFSEAQRMLMDSLLVLQQNQQSVNRDGYFLWLTDSTLTVYEKKRYLASILDRSLSDLQFFILKTEDKQKLLAFADLIDGIMISKLIYSICENKILAATISYWMWLYDWFIEYYASSRLSSPDNDHQLQLKLNLALLHALRRSNGELASKSDLIARFLIELFGQESEKEIQIILNYLEREKTDGATERVSELKEILQTVVVSLKKNADDKSNENKTRNDNERENITSTENMTSLSKKQLQDDISIQGGNTSFSQENIPDIRDSFMKKIDNHFIVGPVIDSTFINKSSLKDTSLFDKKTIIHTEDEISKTPSTPIINEINHVEEKEDKPIEIDSSSLSKNTAAIYVDLSIARSDEELLNLIADKDTAIAQKVKLLNELAVSNTRVFCRMIETIAADSTLFHQLAKTTTQNILLQWFAALSVAKAELLLQVSSLLSTGEALCELKMNYMDKIPEDVIHKALLLMLQEKSKNKDAFLTENDATTTELLIRKIYQVNTIGNNVLNADTQHKIAEGQMLNFVLQHLSISQLEQNGKEIDIEYLTVPNAGLVLLTAWFPKLFEMLGLLNEDKNDFRDTASRIRAIFIIQRLVTSEEKEYQEQELSFNRLLTACPFSIPLPRKLDLTEKEKNAVDSMLVGVKANWHKMGGTSVESFQHSFVERSGKLEQGEERWTLSVESRPYDILLDSLPWSCKLVRFPWLKKYIEVKWRDND